MGVFKVAFAIGNGAGVAAFGGAEEFCFDHLFRYGRHVYRDESLVPSGAGRVDGLSDKFLAAAGFALDQDGRVRRGDQADGSQDGADGLAVTDDFGRTGRALGDPAVTPGFTDQLAAVENPMNGIEEFIFRHGLGKNIDGAGSHRSLGQGEIGIRADDDAGQSRMPLAELFEKAHAGVATEALVNQDQVDEAFLQAGGGLRQ